MRVFKSIIIACIGIGVIGIALNIIFGSETIGYIQSHNNGYITYYTFDFGSYFKNVSMQIQNYYDLSLQTPSDTGDGFKNIANYLIMGINVLLYPIRVGGYIIRVVFTIMGINMTNPSQNIQWLVDFINATVGLTINYVV